MHSLRILPLLIAILNALAACAGVNIPALDPTGRFKPNYVIIHPDGYALDDQSRPLTTVELRGALEATLVPQISLFAKQLQGKGTNAPLSSCNKGEQTVLRLLVFVHGGLNGYDAGFQHMADLLETMHDADQSFNIIKGSCYYPIFVNWDSAGWDSLTDDLFRIRFGHPDVVLGILTSPLVVASRLIGSVANLPVSLIHNGELLAERIAGAKEEKDPGYCIALDTVGYLPAHVLYLATIPLVEGFGTPAWDIMKRRAQLAAAHQLTDEPGSQNATFKRLSWARAGYIENSQMHNPQSVDEGAFRTLINTLHESMRYDHGTWTWADSGVRVEMTFVGHSMGAMLINRALDQVEGIRQPDKTPVEHIVYLAPAAPMDEIAQMVLPYIERVNHPKSMKDHPTTFWMFTLNRRDETREIDWTRTLGVFPRGSLLIWIDTFLESEATWGQSTSGRTWNLMHTDGLEPFRASPGTRNCFTPYWDPADGPAPETLPLTQQFRVRTLAPGSAHRALQDRGLLKLYDSPHRIGADNVPQHHGDFNEPKFFLEALCQVNEGAFRSSNYCQQRPDMFDP